MSLSNTHASVVEQLITLADRLFPGEVRNYRFMRWCHFTRIIVFFFFFFFQLTRSTTLLRIPRQRPYLTATVHILFPLVEVLNARVYDPL